MTSNPPTTHRRTSSKPAALDTAQSTESQTKVESPSLATPQARARFEFEPGKSNDGTKILMVEWEDDDATRNVRGQWTISWEGKSTVLPADERNLAEDSRAEPQTHRMFFLLPPGVSIPTLVTLTLNAADRSREVAVWKTNPLPAIFPPGFAESAVGGNKASKGVLHTLWAKQRLRTLQREIEKEQQFPEGIGLAMAEQEKEWIESTFGLEASAVPHRNSEPRSPTSPLSPGGGRLSEKLKGLKLQTTETGDWKRDSASNPLSPDDGDIAVPSFSAFKDANPNSLAAKPAQKPAATAPVAFVPQAPSRQPGGGVGSIADIMAGTGFAPMNPSTSGEGEDEEAELFALPLSPRSPEMTKSPFSFAQSDTMKYLKDQAAPAVV